MSLDWGSYLAYGVRAYGRKTALIGGNWKCNGTIAEIKKIVDRLNSSGPYPLSSEVVIAVPSIHLLSVKSAFCKDISVAAQDVGLNKNGAYTGEVSAAMLYDAGVRWTLTGHSERRVGFGFPGETNEVVGAKTAIAVKSGLQVIACIGEQLADRESGKTMQICAAQLAAIASCLTIEEWKKVVIAYEPVWAIGTGKVATPEQAEDTHKDIRKWLYDNVSPEVANYVRILYGGSVKGSNCVDLICCPNIDGFLVGGASLLPEFVDIIKCTKGRL